MKNGKHILVGSLILASAFFVTGLFATAGRHIRAWDNIRQQRKDEILRVTDRGNEITHLLARQVVVAQRNPTEENIRLIEELGAELEQATEELKRLRRYE